MRGQKVIRVFAASMAAGFISHSAIGARVTADLNNGLAAVDGDPNGTLNVSSYSEQLGVKNASMGATGQFGGAAQTFATLPAGGPIGAAPGNYISNGVGTTNMIKVPTGGVVFNAALNRNLPAYRMYGPPTSPVRVVPVTLNGVVTSKATPYTKGMLSVAGDFLSSTSMTGQYSGAGSATAFTKPNGSLARELVASAVRNGPLPPPPGAAAGMASDPSEIPAGVYDYDPTIDVSVSLTQYDSGGGVALATDSSVFTSDSVDNFDADGAPLNETLWNVTVGGSGPTASPTSVFADFELNPQALNEITFPSSFLASLGSFSDQTSEAALIDAATDLTLESQLTLNGDEVDLTDASLFPSGTTYTPASDEQEYEDEVEAGIAAAPEPGAVMLAFMAIGALPFRRRKL